VRYRDFVGVIAMIRALYLRGGAFYRWKLRAESTQLI